MKIRKLHIDGFGIFNDKKIEGFTKGVNLLYGPNEKGKSTLLDFFKFTLFDYPRLTADRRPPAPGKPAPPDCRCPAPPTPYSHSGCPTQAWDCPPLPPGWSRSRSPPSPPTAQSAAAPTCSPLSSPASPPCLPAPRWLSDHRRRTDWTMPPARWAWTSPGPDPSPAAGSGAW